MIYPYLNEHTDGSYQRMILPQSGSKSLETTFDPILYLVFQSGLLPSFFVVAGKTPSQSSSTSSAAGGECTNLEGHILELISQH